MRLLCSSRRSQKMNRRLLAAEAEAAVALDCIGITKVVKHSRSKIYEREDWSAVNERIKAAWVYLPLLRRDKCRISLESGHKPTVKHPYACTLGHVLLCFVRCPPSAKYAAGIIQDILWPYPNNFTLKRDSLVNTKNSNLPGELLLPFIPICDMVVLVNTYVWVGLFTVSNVDRMLFPPKYSDAKWILLSKNCKIHRNSGHGRLKP